MQPVSAATVLGDFDDSGFVADDSTARFYRRGDDFLVETTGADGELTEFAVTYTFGAEPLQQYLIEFDDGRVQALSIAWDSRPAEEGGQRWFDLYPDESIDHQDPLHWTGTYQRWNTMCADCHSTDLHKDYDLESDSFATRWTDINVSCESCHGPGSLHVADPAQPLPALAATTRRWTFAPGESIARLGEGEPGNTEIEVCAQCHARRAQLTDEHEPGDAFFDAYRPALLEAGLYHADGQILDEVYVYGSFLQSRMAQAGVTCSDCHEPHSVELRFEGNALCGQCHLASTYDQPEHHRHTAGTAAAECTSCHMREETYMVVDPRRDHSFRVPRPDLSAELGSPNACGDCHDDQTSQWAAEQVAGWYPDGRQLEAHYGEVLQAARTWQIEARAGLLRVIQDPAQPAIVRATAIMHLSERMTIDDTPILAGALDSGEPLLQIAAIEAAAAFDAQRQIDLVQRFLTDDLLVLRTAAARVLLPARDLLSERRRADLERAIGEYLEAQRFNGDRPEGMLNIAGVAIEQGQFENAEAVLREALARHPGFPALYINLADLYRLTGRPQESEAILRTGLEVAPDEAALNLALAYAMVRNGRAEEARPLFMTATGLAPDQPSYAYVLGIAESDADGIEAGLALLREAEARFPGYPDIVFAMATMLRDTGDIDGALVYAERMAQLLPGDLRATSLLRELEQL
jgi:predicted Zn-dependent protease